MKPRLLRKSNCEANACKAKFEALYTCFAMAPSNSLAILVGLDSLGQGGRGGWTSKLGGITVLHCPSRSRYSLIDTIDSRHRSGILSIIYAKSKRPATRRLPVWIVRIVRTGLVVVNQRAVNGSGRVDYGSKDEESKRRNDGDSYQHLGTASHASEGSHKGGIRLRMRSARRVGMRGMRMLSQPSV